MRLRVAVQVNAARDACIATLEPGGSGGDNNLDRDDGESSSNDNDEGHDDEDYWVSYIGHQADSRERSQDQCCWRIFDDTCSESRAR